MENSSSELLKIDTLCECVCVFVCAEASFTLLTNSGGLFDLLNADEI